MVKKNTYLVTVCRLPCQTPGVMETVSAKTGQPGVNILSLGEKASLICASNSVSSEQIHL